MRKYLFSSLACVLAFGLASCDTTKLEDTQLIVIEYVVAPFSERPASEFVRLDYTDDYNGLNRNFGGPIPHTQTVEFLRGTVDTVYVEVEVRARADESGFRLSIVNDGLEVQSAEVPGLPGGNDVIRTRELMFVIPAE